MVGQNCIYLELLSLHMFFSAFFTKVSEDWSRQLMVQNEAEKNLYFYAVFEDKISLKCFPELCQLSTKNSNFEC